MNKLWQAYKYTFYWLYTWQRGVWGENDLPHLNTILGMSMTLSANIASFDVILHMLFQIDIIPLNFSRLSILFYFFFILFIIIYL
jgi:hypothetical protein